MGIDDSYWRVVIFNFERMNKNLTEENAEKILLQMTSVQIMATSRYLPYVIYYAKLAFLLWWSLGSAFGIFYASMSTIYEFYLIDNDVYFTGFRAVVAMFGGSITGSIHFYLTVDVAPPGPSEIDGVRSSDSPYLKVLHSSSVNAMD